jgi:hypothetical protein
MQGREESAVSRPPVLSDCRAGHPARLRHGLARFRDHRRTRRAAAGCSASDPVRLHANLGAGGLRPPKRLDLGPLTVPAAPYELDRPGSPRRCHHDRQQVRHPHQRQTPVQPDELRDCLHDAHDRSGLDLTRAVGQCGILRVSDGLSWRARGESRGAQRRHVRIHRVISHAPVWPIALSRRADDDSNPSVAEWSASLVHVLHDFRPADHAELTTGPCALRVARRRWHMVRAVPAVPDERPSLVARRLLAAGPVHRPAVTGTPIHLDAPGRRTFVIEEG